MQMRIRIGATGRCVYRTDMASLEPPTSRPARDSAIRGRKGNLFCRPVALFVVLSALIGTPLVFLVPPLRGADEPAHFLRVYAISTGQIVPSLADEQGRRGIFLPASLNVDYQFFEAMRYRFGNPGFNYRDVFAEFARRGPEPQAHAPPAFVLYAGSEAYSPIPYLPYLPAVFVARALNLDFLPMLWLMRITGFVVMTAAVAYAIAMVRQLKWAFVVIAVLPIGLYERVIISADGAALSFAMVVTALCLRTAGEGRAGASQRSLWMTLCVLVKPSQVPFIALEAMTRPFKELLSQWGATALVVAPGLVLTGLWLFMNSADMGAWRMVEGTGAPPEQFNVGWKLIFLIGHPQHFFSAVAGSLGGAYDLWRESIGALGWRDTHLVLPIYLALTAVFLASCLVRLELDRRTRARVAAVAGVTMLGYWATIFLIFYLAWTPIDAPFIHGVQGRYFTISLPPAAVMIAALIDRAPPPWITAALATLGATVAGAATLEAVVSSQW